MYQSQILPPGPHFVIRLISMAHFNIFCKPNVKDGQRVHSTNIPLIKIYIFKRKKKKGFHYFFKDFWGFCQIQLPGGKIWDWYIIPHYFAKHLTNMLTSGRYQYRNGKFKGQNALCVFLNINVVYERPLSLKWELTLLTPYISFCTSLLQKRTEKRLKKENCKLHSNNAWQKLKVRKLVVFCYQNCYDLLWEKKCCSVRENILKFEAEGREFSKFLRSLKVS